MSPAKALSERETHSRSATDGIPESAIDAEFGILFADHRHRVFSTAVGLTGRREDAEDLTVETFLRAFGALSGVGGQPDSQHPRVWLSAIVIGLWRSLCRTPPGWPSARQSPAASGVNPLAGTDQPVRAQRADSELATALLLLPERQATAVVLHHVAGLAIPEVAEVMGCPSGSVIAQLHRGLDRLSTAAPSGGADERALSSALSGLALPAPDGLGDRIVARWVYVGGTVEDAFVASTSEGIAAVVPASTVAGATGMAAAFRRSLGRPLVSVDTAPEGVAEALRGGRGNTGLRFDLRGRTEFERAVLGATLSIPPGELRPYSWVANEIGRPRAVRAVGTALGHNPVPLLIPCHRVIRADGTMGRFGSLGTAMKRRLLHAEGVDVDKVERLAREGSAYVGDERSRLVCLPTCHRLSTVSPADRRGFPTLGDAEAAGCLPCPQCRPVGR